MTPEIIAPESGSTQFQCRHIFADGRRCGSPAIRGPEGADSFCYFHHNSRRPIQDAPARRRRQSRFSLPNPEDRSAIQQSIGEVLRRIASNEIDPRRAGLLLYGLQIASLNLPKPNPSERPSSIVSEVTLDPEHGLLAPPAELGHDRPMGSAQRLLMELDELEERDRAEFERNRQREEEIRQAAMIDLEASSDPETSSDPKVYPASTTSAPTVPHDDPSKLHRPLNSHDQKESSHEFRSHHRNAPPPGRARAERSTSRQQDSPAAPDLYRRRSGCS